MDNKNNLSNHTVYDTVIIGGGPGGYTAALYCARSGLSVLVLEKFSPGGQMTVTEKIENYPGFNEGIDGFELGERMKKGAEEFGTETAFTEVTSVDLISQPKIITTTDGEVRAHTVILATGASPRKLGLPGEDTLIGKGIAYCAACDGMFYKEKTVAVIGSGNSAAEDALLLSKICKKVYLLYRHENLKADTLYKTALKNSSVKLMNNTNITQLLFDNKLNGILITHTGNDQISHLDCDAVFVAIGRVPNTDMFRNQLNIDNSGYIIADETTKTNVPGVFAVGDVRTKPLRQVITAASDGAVASKSADEFISQLK